MTRSLVLLPILFSGACSVGSYGEVMNMTDGTMMGGDDRDICVAKLGTPAAAHNHTVLGAGGTPATAAGPRSGVGCLAAGGCHGASPGSTVFSVAGSAYKSLAGTTASAGLTVRLYMPGTKKSIAKVNTDAAGNFYLSTPVTFPAGGLEADITGCGSSPDIIPMISPIRANEANCSSSTSCHIVPGPQAIYLP